MSKRSRLEGEERARELYLEGVLAAAPDAIVTLNAQHKVVEWNAGAEQLFGWTRAEAIGIDLDHLITNPSVYDEALTNTKSALQGQAVGPVESVRFRKDGQPVHVLLAGSPILVGEELLGLVAVYTDISERKAAAHALEGHNRNLALLNQVGRTLTATLDLPQVLEQLLRAAVTIADAEGSSVWLWDERNTGDLICKGILLDGAYHAPSDWRLGPGEGIAGWAAATGQTTIVSDPVADARFFSGIDQKTGFQTQSLLTVPLIMRDRIYGTLQVANKRQGDFEQDRTLIETLAASAAIAIENARLVKGLAAEVAARTAEIRAEQEKSEAILCSVGDAISMSNLNWQIEYVNDAFTAETGYAANEIMGRRSDFILTEESCEQLGPSLHTTLQTGENWHSEVVIRRRDGRTYEADMTITPMRDAEGQVTGYVSSHRDISHTKKLERARQRFITNVSHQLRTPLTSLQLYVHLLQGIYQDGTGHRYLDCVHEQVTRLTHLTEDILEMTTLDSGNGVRSWGLVSIPLLVETVIAGYEDQAREKNMAVRTEPSPPDLPQVKGDQVGLTKAFGELVANAVTFTPCGGTVTIKIDAVEEAGQSWVTLSVHDTGPGIPPGEQERIFERFFRGSLAESGHIPGTGLGLSMAQEIAQAHGGQVTFVSPNGKLALNAPTGLHAANGGASGSYVTMTHSPSFRYYGAHAGGMPGPGSTFVLWLRGEKN